MELLDLGVSWNEELASDYKPLEAPREDRNYWNVRELFATRAKRKPEALGATVSGSASKKLRCLLPEIPLVQSYQKRVSWV